MYSGVCVHALGYTSTNAEPTADADLSSLVKELRNHNNL